VCKILVLVEFVTVHLKSAPQHNLQSLIEATGMPRRTLQDCIADMSDIFVDCHFVQNGVRNNDGYYQLSNWGPISKYWVEENISVIKTALFEEQ
jgi:hypothetical protein